MYPQRETSPRYRTPSRSLPHDVAPHRADPSVNKFGPVFPSLTASVARDRHAPLVDEVSLKEACQLALVSDQRCLRHLGILASGFETKAHQFEVLRTRYCIIALLPASSSLCPKITSPVAEAFLPTIGAAVVEQYSSTTACRKGKHYCRLITHGSLLGSIHKTIAEQIEVSM